MDYFIGKLPGKNDIDQTKQEELWGSSFKKLTSKQRQLVSEILSYSTMIRHTSKIVELPEQELKAKTGTFLNPVTGAVWQLSSQEGKIAINVPNFCFQISPLNSTKFVPVNSLVNLEFEFEQRDPRSPWLMHIYAKGIRRATFEAQ